MGAELVHESSKVHFNLSQLYESLGNYAKALEHIEADLKICKMHHLQLDLAKAYLECGTIHMWYPRESKEEDYDTAQKVSWPCEHQQIGDVVSTTFVWAYPPCS